MCKQDTAAAENVDIVSVIHALKATLHHHARTSRAHVVTAVADSCFLLQRYGVVDQSRGVYCYNKIVRQKNTLPCTTRIFSRHVATALKIL